MMIVMMTMTIDDNGGVNDDTTLLAWSRLEKVTEKAWVNRVDFELRGFEKYFYDLNISMTMTMTMTSTMTLTMMKMTMMFCDCDRHTPRQRRFFYE